jgi:hypothetical protein
MLAAIDRDPGEKPGGSGPADGVFPGAANLGKLVP